MPGTIVAGIAPFLINLKIDKEYLVSIRDLAQVSMDSSTLLVEALKESKKEYRKALEIINDIEVKEDEGDTLYIKSLAISRRYRDFLLYKLIDNIENSIDAAEDASDVLEEIIVRIIR